ncbi:MAG: type II secretion system protein [Candidatus Omnitrophica bacterium]|nr:type II secretion system protein [Candidatus Omnitrophota bacterium]
MKNKKAFSLVEILVVVGIIALLSAIAMPNLIRAKVSANESAARATLKLISNSLENYSAINSVYPNDTSLLLGASPPYLTIDYFTGNHNGYTYNKTLGVYFYTITATPINTNTGTTTFTMSTGGVLSPQ